VSVCEGEAALAAGADAVQILMLWRLFSTWAAPRLRLNTRLLGGKVQLRQRVAS